MRVYVRMAGASAATSRLARGADEDRRDTKGKLKMAKVKLSAAQRQAWARNEAKKKDDELTSLTNVLIYSDDDGPAMAAKVLCAVEFLIDVETEYGNQDLSGWVAHGLSEIIHDVVGSLHSIVHAAARDEAQS